MLAALPSLFVISPFFSNHAQLHFSTAIRFFHFTRLRIVMPSLRSHIGTLVYVPSSAVWG